MRDYNFSEIEKKWQARWVQDKTYRVVEDEKRRKFYILNMFPYPSGAGLHVGHPLGYIASDIYARFKRQQGFNVLNPMGYDSYGLPAEQYAIQTGQHPEKTTFENIDRYRSQLDKIGFCFDWDREVRTCDPDYYKWTQWAFQKMFNSYFDEELQKAQPIEKLIEKFKSEGTWPSDEKAQSDLLMNYRLAFLGETMVNWCPKLGTVLANDEVVEGVSVRGGYPVEQKKMRQWCLRISAYSQRLLDGLDTIQWSESIKETQRNWIGRSEGTEVEFRVADSNESFTIFTTRADTMFGVTFMVLAPESELVAKLTTPAQKAEVDKYLAYVKSRTERERMIDHTVTGVFSGSYAVNPFTGEKNPIWISEYVLAGYGTGAIMAVPAHDSRDYAFARHFNLPIIPLIEGADVSQESYDAKEGIVSNSPAQGKTSVMYDGESLVLNGMTVKEAIAATKDFVEKHNIGRVKVNYRLRDAIFSRQRYWGEPFPIYYKDGMPYPIPVEELPVRLPEIDEFKPTETGEPPLARAKEWTYKGYPMEYNTMPGFAGSSGYYLRYMDPHNDQEYFSKESNEYWRNVDLYVGGAEHATGHLIYSRFWNKFLFDIGLSCEEEPFKRLINQGMIQGRTNFVYRIVGTNKYVSLGLKDQYDVTPIRVDVNIVRNDVLDTEAFKKWMPDFADAEFILEDGQYICGWEVEKMSKSKYNVQNPDDLVEKYGADTLRMYEMFLGPIEMAKPWDTNGIEGVFRFIKKFWRLFHDKDYNWCVSEEEPTREEYKILHKTIKKIEEDNEKFSFNTAVSAFMICTNELGDAKCNKRKILEPLCILMSAYAPHVTEELWALLGHDDSIVKATFPSFDESYLQETDFTYPVSFNGKMRVKLSFPVNYTQKEIEPILLANADVQKWLDGKQPKKIIVVPKRIINIVF
ncbi:MAG: leucine--tRNA ligase [Bacteroidales bacterium]|nr:leucine--tRNA ligase [Bacteroidales bacterium]